MFSSCRCASDNFSVPAEQTCLLYKECPSSLASLGTTSRSTVRSSFTLDLAARPETCRRPKVGSGRESDCPNPGEAAWRSAGGPSRAAGPTGPGRRDLGRNPSRVRPCAGDVPRVLRPGRESDALGRAGRELPGLAGRGREVVLHRGGPPGGHQSSDPGGGQGRVDARQKPPLPSTR